jgi:hypothetical protein
VRVLRVHVCFAHTCARALGACACVAHVGVVSTARCKSVSVCSVPFQRRASCDCHYFPLVFTTCPLLNFLLSLTHTHARAHIHTRAQDDDTDERDSELSSSEESDYEDED